MHRGAGILLRWYPGREMPRYLVQRRGQAARDHRGEWDHSAFGRLEPGEGPLDGALREYQEEMGEIPRPLVIAREATWLPAPGGPSSCDRVTLFLADVQEAFIPDYDPDQVAEAAWVTALELAGLDLHPSFAVELPLLIAGFPLPGEVKRWRAAREAAMKEGK